MKVLYYIVGTIFALYLCAQVVPGFYISTFFAAAMVSVLLGVCAITIRPLLLVLTLPITLLTFGLFSFVINAGILLAIAGIVDGFSIDGFVPALLSSILIVFVQWIVQRFA
ncbi:phage holin family protein [Patescibacteria group bacterium]|nr:phage holin family protein [Patescibacteria group bacterium]